MFVNGENHLVDNLKLLAGNAPKYKIKNLVDTSKTEGVDIFNFPKKDIMEVSEELLDFVEYINMEKAHKKDPLALLRSTFDYIKAGQVGGKGEIKSEEIVSIIELLEMIIEEGEVETISEFLYEIENRNTRLHGRAETTDLTIQLTTVHDFKGKEADSIYIWKDTDKMFPSERSTEADFEEERRIHYIAGTRAKQKSTMLTIAGHESPFIAEMGITPITYVGEGVKRMFTAPKTEAEDIIDDIYNNHM